MYNQVVVMIYDNLIFLYLHQGKKMIVSQDIIHFQVKKHHLIFLIS